MSLLSLLVSNQVEKSKVAALQLDALISVTTDANAEVTSNPIEDGSDVSDHVRLGNIQISIEAIVSESPVNLLAAAGGLAAGAASNFLGSAVGGFLTTAAVTAIGSVAGMIANRRKDDIQYPEKAYNYLLELRKKRIPFTVVFNKKSYDNMILKTISRPEKAENGESLMFTATLEQIQIVQTKTVLIPKQKIKGDRAASAASKVKTGKQGTEETTSKKSSLLFKGLKGLGALG